jgi:hypothetical protein
VKVFGCHRAVASKHQRAQVRADIQRAAQQEGLGDPSFDFLDFHRALIEAKTLKDEGKSVAIVGSLRHLDPPLPSPTDIWSATEWREAWLSLAREYGVIYVPVGTAPVCEEEASTTKHSIIRRYQAACAGLRRHLRRIRATLAKQAAAHERGYAGGRPPYGYRVEKGHLITHEEQARAVREVFAQAADPEATMGTICAHMKAAFAGEFWDRVKVRRVLQHAHLYETGAYTPRGSEPFPGLPRLVIIRRADRQAGERLLARLRAARGRRSRLPTGSGAGTIGATRT